MSTPGTPLFVNADWSAIVPAGSVEAAFGIDVDTAKRLGLLEGKPAAEPVTIKSANLVVAEPALDEPAEPEPEEAPVAEPEVKQAPKPANKAARKPRNK